MANIDEKEFLNRITGHIMSVFDSMLSQIDGVEPAKVEKLRYCVRPGKMLRSRLAYALLGADSDVEDVIRACAATEMIHTATLFHDDVIDGADLRRGREPMWKTVGATGAILLGDLLYSSALELVIAGGKLKHVSSYVQRIKEVCAIEATHELLLRGKTVNVQDSIRIARGKTGALFAFPAEVAGGDSTASAEALSEVGYLIGAAYQIADDLIDELGDEDVVGKTLGTDRKRSKYTIAQAPDADEHEILDQIHYLCDQAVELVQPWPVRAAALSEYIDAYLMTPKKLNFKNVTPARK